MDEIALGDRLGAAVGEDADAVANARPAQLSHRKATSTSFGNSTGAR
jgi:hypothetical protein